MKTEKTRYEQGLVRMAEVLGQVGEETVAPLGDLGRYIVEFGYGDVYGREGLSTREREIAAVALLTSMGGREPQLRVHLQAALRSGLTVEELREVIIYTAAAAGFPSAINATVVLNEVAASRAAAQEA